MVNLLSAVILDLAVVLVAGGVVLIVLVRERQDLARATAPLALGIAVLLAALHHPVEGGVIAIVGAASAAMLWPGGSLLPGRRSGAIGVEASAGREAAPGRRNPRLRGRRSAPDPNLDDGPWLGGEDGRGLDLSVGALALVGAVALAVNHPLIGVLRADIAVDALLLGALFAVLVGDTSRHPLRALEALSAGLLAGITVLVLGGTPLPRATLFAFAALQLIQSFAVASLFSVRPRAAVVVGSAAPAAGDDAIGAFAAPGAIGAGESPETAAPADEPLHATPPSEAGHVGDAVESAE